MTILHFHLKPQYNKIMNFIYISQNVPTSFPGSLFPASLSRWNRDPGCDWSRDHLSIRNRRVAGYSSTFGREDNKILPCCPTLPADFSSTQILGGHVTRVSVPTIKGGREETPWDRGSKYTFSAPRNLHIINYAILSSYRNTIINQSARVFS